jgi:catalase
LTQAQLFYNSLSPIKNLHQKNAYSFEFDHCDGPVVYNRMAKHLAEIDLSLSQNVAEKVGAPVPEKQVKPNHGKKAKGLG